MYGLNDLEVRGLDGLLGVLERRKTQGRERGLLTVCNHVAVYVKFSLRRRSFFFFHSFANHELNSFFRLDDPLIWGILPFRYAFDGANMRWGLGAHDICFKNK